MEYPIHRDFDDKNQNNIGNWKSDVLEEKYMKKNTQIFQKNVHSFNQK